MPDVEPLPTSVPATIPMVDAAGAPIEVPHTDVREAFLGKGYGFAQGSRVPMVAANGQFGHVEAGKAQEAFQSGARVATPEEIHKAQIHAEYDNFGGFIASGAAEAANQALLGAGDALAVGAAKAVGSAATAEKVRQTLSDLREENPGSTIAGGVVGALAPLALTGGESGVARILSAPTRALGAVGDVAGHVGAAMPQLGESMAAQIAHQAITQGARAGAEGAILNAGNDLTEQTLGGDPELNGEKLLAALGHGALLGGAFGSILGATGAIGRNVIGRATPGLQDAAGEQYFRALNPERRFVKLAEKIPGGAAGVGGELRGIVEAGDKIDEIAPKVNAARKAQGELVGQSLDDADAAGIQGPRIADVEAQVRRDVIADLAKMGNTNRGAIAKAEGLLADLRNFAESHAPHIEPAPTFRIDLAPGETRAPKATKAIEFAGRDEPRLLNPDAGLTDEGGAGWRIVDGKPVLSEEPERSPLKFDYTRPGHIAEPSHIDERMTEGADTGPAAFGTERAYDVGLKPGAVVEEPLGSPRVDRATFEEGGGVTTRTKFGTEPEGLVPIRKPIKMRLDEEATAKARELARREYDESLTLSFKQAQEFRARLDDHIKWATNPLSPVNETTEALKGVRHAIEDTLVEAGDKAEGKLGKTWAEEYQERKLRYRRLAVADQAAENAVAALTANRVVSPSDYLAGLAGFAGGGLHGGLAGLALGAAHHVIRERGNATAAVLLDKVATFAAIQHAARAVDAEVDRGIAGLLEPGKRAQVKLKPEAFGKSSNPYRSHADAVTGAAAGAESHAEDVENAVAPIAGHAPKTAKAFQAAALRTTIALANLVPKGHLPAPSITPQLDRGQVTDGEREKYDRARAIMHDPVGVMFTRAAKGTLTRSDVDLFKQTSPKLYEAVVARTQEQLAHVKAPLDTSRETQLRVLMGMAPADPHLAGIMQSTYAPTPGQPKPNQGPTGTGPKATPKQREGLANRQRLAGLNSETEN